MFRAEGVPLDLDTAGVASRLLARTLDFVVCFGGLYLVLTALAIASPPRWLMIAAIVVAFFVALFVYPAVLETVMRGRTVGKMAAGLRVVTESGGPISFRHAATRSALTVVDLLATSGVVGIASIMFSQRRQRLGDVAAGTVVIRTRYPENRREPITAPQGFESFTESLDIRPVDPVLLSLVRDVLPQSAGAATGHPSARLARLAELIDAQLGGRRPDRMGHDVFLRCVVARAAATARSARPLRRAEPVA